MIDNIKRFLLLLFSQFFVTDSFSSRFPVSIKGILLHEGKVILLKNERNEWDLPGGKLNKNETVEKCLEREIYEELNLAVSVDKIISSDIVNVKNKINVVVIVYSCTIKDDISNLKISFEHKDLNYFSLKELDNINIYDSYKKIIAQEMVSIGLI